MKRRYKLLIIIFIGCFFTIIIHNKRENNKVTLVAMGDSLSIGMTPYGIIGTSFTDYLKEYLVSIGKLNMYNYDYSQDHLLIDNLIDNIKDNNIKEFLPIQQIIAKSDILTIAIGIDEMVDISYRKDIDNEDITVFIQKYDELLYNIRKYTNSKIIVIGLYPANNISKNTIIDINKRLKVICGKYNVNFIDILPFTINKDYYFNNSSYYLNYRIHKVISKIIVKSIS